MARERSIKRDKAFELYKSHKGNIKLVDIAKELDISDVQVRKWKSQDKWDNNLKGTLPIKKVKSKGNVTNKKVTKKKVKKEAFEEEVKEVLENTNLTDKQKLFCSYYIRCFNATKAYQKAYECSYQTANVEGFKSLVKPSIKAEIDKLKASKLNRAMLSVDDIFQKYIDIAFTDINDFMEFGQKEVPALNPITGEQLTDENGELVTYTVDYAHFKDSSEVDGSLISEVSKGKDGAKIKLEDKMKALQWLSDRMDLLPIATQRKLEIEKEKLELAKTTANKDTNIDKPIEIVIKRKGEN